MTIGYLAVWLHGKITFWPYQVNSTAAQRAADGSSSSRGGLMLKSFFSFFTTSLPFNAPLRSLPAPGFASWTLLCAHTRAKNDDFLSIRFACLRDWMSPTFFLLCHWGPSLIAHPHHLDGILQINFFPQNYCRSWVKFHEDAKINWREVHTMDVLVVSLALIYLCYLHTF